MRYLLSLVLLIIAGALLLTGFYGSDSMSSHMHNGLGGHGGGNATWLVGGAVLFLLLAIGSALFIRQRK